MVPMLYEPFQHWAENGSVYIYSDPHFDDADCQLMDANWPAPGEQVKKINSIVHKCDTLIILGDIGDTSWVTKLKAGYKVLIAGNHDSGRTKYLRRQARGSFPIKDFTCVKELKNILAENFPDTRARVYAGKMNYMVEMDNHLFDEVYEGPLFITPKICLSHEPIDLGFGLNIHGHKHDLAGGGYDTNHYNVCSNTIDYTPVNLAKLIKDGYVSRAEDIHRLTIDNAVERKNKEG